MISGEEVLAATRAATICIIAIVVGIGKRDNQANNTPKMYELETLEIYELSGSSRPRLI